jgi:hypothetical protein
LGCTKPDGTPRKLMDISKCMRMETSVQLEEEIKKHTIGFRDIDRFKQEDVEGLNWLIV